MNFLSVLLCVHMGETAYNQDTCYWFVKHIWDWDVQGSISRAGSSADLPRWAKMQSFRVYLAWVWAQSLCRSHESQTPDITSLHNPRNHCICFPLKKPESGRDGRSPSQKQQRWNWQTPQVWGSWQVSLALSLSPRLERKPVSKTRWVRVGKGRWGCPLASTWTCIYLLKNRCVYVCIYVPTRCQRSQNCLTTIS